jgi:hypothetical protein
MDNLLGLILAEAEFEDMESLKASRTPTSPLER